MIRFRRPPPPNGPLPCAHVGKLLQSFLDGETDPRTTRLVAEHLEDCRRCGLEAAVYTEIRASLARHAPVLSAASVDRLRRFGERLAIEGDGALG